MSAATLQCKHFSGCLLPWAAVWYYYSAGVVSNWVFTFNLNNRKNGSFQLFFDRRLWSLEVPKVPERDKVFMTLSKAHKT